MPLELVQDPPVVPRSFGPRCPACGLRSLARSQTGTQPVEYICTTCGELLKLPVLLRKIQEGAARAAGY